MKTVLIITYYWPPSGGSGVQRWLKFANYLGAYGWHPIIVTPENPQFELKDPSLEKEVDSEIEVLRIPIWEPYQFFDKIRGTRRHQQGHTSIAPWAKFIRGNFFLPDPRIFWKRPVVKFLSEFLKQRSVDFIVSTGPPHSMHLIARKLSNKFGIPWLADFRDPWSTWDMLDEFHTSHLARSIHKNLEKKVMKDADVVLTVSPAWGEEMSVMYGRPVEVITNGYDDRDFQDIEVSKPDRFRISHFGLINEFRYVPDFWEALELLCKTNKEFADVLEVDLYGVIDHEVLSRLKKFSRLSTKIKFHGSISHEKVLEFYGKSAVVLMFMNQSSNARGHLPGKLFEYLAAGRPILALGDPGGDAAEIIDACQAGKVFSRDDKSGIRDQLLDWYSEYRHGSLPVPDSVKVENFSRKKLTVQLASLMEKHFS